MRVRQGQWAKLNDDAEVLWEAYRRDSSEENRNLLATHYYTLARFVAFNCWRKLKIDIQTDLDDLTSCAAMALIDCVERFDQEREIAFTTWAPFRLHGACIDHIREMDWVPRLERVAQRQGKVNPVGITSLDTDRKFNAGTTQAAYQDAATFHDVLAESDRSELVIARDNREFFDEACKSLNQRDRMIVIAYYQDDLTMKEIGRALGLSESRVSQCHSQIVRRLKENWSKHGKPSDRQPQTGGRGARAYSGDAGAVRTTQGRDGEGPGNQYPLPVREAEPVRNAKRRMPEPEGVGPGRSDRGVPAKPRRKLAGASNRKADQRAGQKGRGLPAKRKPVRATGTRAVVPVTRKAKR